MFLFFSSISSSFFALHQGKLSLNFSSLSLSRLPLFHSALSLVSLSESLCVCCYMMSLQTRWICDNLRPLLIYCLFGCCRCFNDSLEDPTVVVCVCVRLASCALVTFAGRLEVTWDQPFIYCVRVHNFIELFTQSACSESTQHYVSTHTQARTHIHTHAHAHHTELDINTG